MGWANRILELATETGDVAGAFLFKHARDSKASGIIAVLGIDAQFHSWCYVLPQRWSRTLEEAYAKHGDKIRSSGLSSWPVEAKYSETFRTNLQKILFEVDISEACVRGETMFDVRFLITVTPNHKL